MGVKIDEIQNALRLIEQGGEISFDEIQALNWEVPKELDAFVQNIYRELQIFSSDLDIRSKDMSYDKSWRSGISDLSNELAEKLKHIS